MIPTVDWAPGPLQERVEYVGVLLVRWADQRHERHANAALREIDAALSELHTLRRRIDIEVRAERADAEARKAVSGG